MVRNGPPEREPDRQGPNTSVNMRVHPPSDEDAAWRAIVARWPQLSAEARDRLAQLARELAEEDQPGTIAAHRTPNAEPKGHERES